MNVKALLASLLVIASAMAATVPVTATQQGEAYNGTHVSFETGENAVVDYTVSGSTVLENLTVQSKSEAQNSGAVSAGVQLSTVTSIPAAGISGSSSAETSASVAFESGAELKAHDNGRGVLLVRSGGEDHYVKASLSSNSEAQQTGDKRVVVTTGEGTQAVFLVIGDGDVTVNQDGEVVAEIGQDGRLCYRQYQGERSDNDKQQERLITNGTAAAEVYIQQAGEDGQEMAADVVQYGEDTTVNVTEKAESNVEMTVERTESEGKVVITTVSEQVFDSAQDIQVQVDGDAAARADSYGQIRQATQGNDNSAFLVRQSSSAQGTVDVVVGINRFSERTVTMTSGDSGGDGGTETGDAGPGFGGVAALVGIVAALILARNL